MRTREEINAYRRRWRRENGDRERASGRAYYAKNADRERLKARTEWARNGFRRRARARAYAVKYRTENPDKVRESKRETMLRYRERYLEMGRARYRANKAKHVAGCKRWNSKNKEKVRAYKRAWSKRNPEKTLALRLKRLPELKEYGRQWAKRNAPKMREYTNRRRARKIAATTEDCSEKVRLLSLRRFCHWCCISLTRANRTIDHVVPLFHGGRHTPDNLVAACQPCNASKGKKFVHEWTWKEAA